MLSLGNIDNILLFGIACLNAYTAWSVMQAHKHIVITQQDVHKIEVATNSMKDALVASTASAFFAKGKEAGHIAEQTLVNEHAAAFAEGVKSTQPPTPGAP